MRRSGGTGARSCQILATLVWGLLVFSAGCNECSPGEIRCKGDVYGSCTADGDGPFATSRWVESTCPVACRVIAGLPACVGATEPVAACVGATHRDLLRRRPLAVHGRVSDPADALRRAHPLRRIAVVRRDLRRRRHPRPALLGPPVLRWRPPEHLQLRSRREPCGLRRGRPVPRDERRVGVHAIVHAGPALRRSVPTRIGFLRRRHRVQLLVRVRRGRLQLWQHPMCRASRAIRRL